MLTVPRPICSSEPVEDRRRWRGSAARRTRAPGSSTTAASGSPRTAPSAGAGARGGGEERERHRQDDVGDGDRRGDADRAQRDRPVGRDFDERFEVFKRPAVDDLAAELVHAPQRREEQQRTAPRGRSARTTRRAPTAAGPPAARAGGTEPPIPGCRKPAAGALAVALTSARLGRYFRPLAAARRCSPCSRSGRCRRL